MPRRHPRPFDYHQPEGEQITRIEAICSAFQDCYEQVVGLTQEGSMSGRYVSLACTALEEAAVWATKSVVFERDNEPKKQPEP